MDPEFVVEAVGMVVWPVLFVEVTRLPGKTCTLARQQ